MTRSTLLAALTLTAATAAAQTLPANDVFPTVSALPDGTRVLELRLAGCAFPAAEPEPLILKGSKAEDCERINRVSADIRKKGLKRLRLKAGKYVIRVINDGNAWPSGFHWRGAQDLSLPVVQGDQILPGQGKEFRVDLQPGAYVYSDPASRTFDYPVLVER